MSWITFHILLQIELIVNYIAVTCLPLILPNGTVQYSSIPLNGRYYINTAASFTCECGWYLLGVRFATCHLNTGWDQQMPQCIPGNKYLCLPHWL